MSNCLFYRSGGGRIRAVISAGAPNGHRDGRWGHFHAKSGGNSSGAVCPPEFVIKFPCLLRGPSTQKNNRRIQLRRFFTLKN
jgi:hypothetical protein